MIKLLDEPIVNPRSKWRLISFGGLVAGLIVFGVLLYVLRPEPTPLTAPPITPTTQLKPPQTNLKLVATGLGKPTAIVSTGQNKDGRLFVLDRDGLIRIVQSDGTVNAQPFLDIRSQVQSEGEMGLLGLAFSPKYQTDGYFFVNYIDQFQTTNIVRYHVSSNADQADAGSGENVLTLKQPFVNHNGGDLVFGPDKYLYVALGDGGSAGDPGNRAQDLGSLFGKILRLDVNKLPYSIPSNNPFTKLAKARPEIWAYGLRNPWRLSFDSKTHYLYIADVGQGNIEEINIETDKKGGHNYGWRCFEGSHSFNQLGCNPKDSYVFPITEYDHNNNRCSVTGGYVYRGKLYPALTGKYFYGDYCNGELFWTEKQGTEWKQTLAIDSPYKISTFGTDNNGEIYLGDFNTGNIYQIQDTANK